MEIKCPLPYLLLTLLVIGSFQISPAQSIRLYSPDRGIQVTVNTAGQLSYAVSYMGKAIVLQSSMGFEFKNEPPMGAGMVLLAEATHTVNERWKPVVAVKHAVISNHYNELEIKLREDTGLMRRMDLFFRAYDDGVAFRYILYRSENTGNREITREKTDFRFMEGAKAWIAEYGGYATSNESEFMPHPLSYINEHTIAGLPMLIEIDKDHYAALTEAAIDHYPGYYLGAENVQTDSIQAGGTQGDSAVSLTTKLAPLPGEAENGVKVRFSDTLSSPWRVVMLGAQPGKLITSEIVQNLNAPCLVKDPSWIKAGMSAWDNWWSGDVKMDMPTIKKYIDFAGKMGWPYMLIDWQWYGPFNKPSADITKAAPQLDMPEILRYARSRHVRCWLWLYNSDVNRNGHFKKAFPLYERWGIAGVKIDFMNRDDQDMVDWYHDIVKTAAAHHLLVDFHGAYKPDGIGRTYPNLLTREGVTGEEYSKFSNRVTDDHNVTLPFTRMLAGPMDYTPGGFLNVTRAAFRQASPTEVMNTRCAELSKFVIYESPFTVVCDAPEHILGQPGADFLRMVHTTWDDIRVPAGYPGEYIVVAKRSGKDWFLGAMTNRSARQLSIKLDFLSAGMTYKMDIWQDAADAATHPEHLVKSSRLVRTGDTMAIDMAESGGYVARLQPTEGK
jgi:alpha-glucosidase